MRRVGKGLFGVVLLVLVLTATVSVPSALAEGTVTIEPLPSLAKVAPRIEGTASTVEGDELTVTIEGSGGGSVHPSVNFSGEWSYTPSLSDGSYTARAIQLNEAKEVVGSDARPFRIDSTAPKVAISTPPAVTKIATPTLGGGAGAEEGDQEVLVTIHELKPEARTIVPGTILTGLEIAG